MTRFGRVSVAAALIAAACAVPPTGSIALDDAAAAAPGDDLLIPVLLNDRAPVGETLTITGVGGSAGSVSVAADGQLAYTAEADFSGEDRFSYTVTSESGSEASANVVVTVGGSATTTTTTTTDPPRDSRLVIFPAEFNFGEVFVTQPAEVRVEFVAESGNFSIQPIEQRGVQLLPEESCLSLDEGQRCAARVEWVPGAPGELNEEIVVAGDASLRAFGTAVHALRFEPREQPLDTASPREPLGFGSMLVNVSNRPVDLQAIEVEGSFAGAALDLRRCEEILDGMTLGAGQGCFISVQADISRSSPGEVLEGGIVVRYGETSMSAIVSVQVGAPSPLVWIRPVPGQHIWKDIILEGFSVEWEVEPLATSYQLTAAMCWDSDSDCLELLTSGPQTSPVGEVAVLDPAEFEAIYQALVEGGIAPDLVLTATPSGVNAPEPSELRLVIEPGPFAIGPVVYEPDWPASLGCGQDRVSLTLPVHSFLLDTAPLSVVPWGGGFERGTREPATADVAPAEAPNQARISFIVGKNGAIDQMRFQLGGLMGPTDFVDYSVSGCLE